MILAASRSHAIDLALFVHVLGAMVLVGALLVAAAAVLAGGRDPRLLRLGYFTLLAVALPGYLVMRVGAEWTYAKEHLDELPSDPAWVGIGYITADAGALLLLVALVLGGFGVRRLADGRTGLVRASLFIAVLLLAVYTVTVWAMGAKPS